MYNTLDVQYLIIYKTPSFLTILFDPLNLISFWQKVG